MTWELVGGVHDGTIIEVPDDTCCLTVIINPLEDPTYTGTYSLGAVPRTGEYGWKAYWKVDINRG